MRWKIIKVKVFSLKFSRLNVFKFLIFFIINRINLFCNLFVLFNFLILLRDILFILKGFDRLLQFFGLFLFKFLLILFVNSCSFLVDSVELVHLLFKVFIRFEGNSLYWLLFPKFIKVEFMHEYGYEIYFEHNLNFFDLFDKVLVDLKV